MEVLSFGFDYSCQDPDECTEPKHKTLESRRQVQDFNPNQKQALKLTGCKDWYIQNDEQVVPRTGRTHITLHMTKGRKTE